MSDATSVSRNNPTIKIEPPDFSTEDVNRENEDEFDSIDGIVKSESPSEDDKTCLQRFMNSEVTIDEEVKQELDDEGEKLFECSICNKAFITKYLLDLHVCDTLEKHSNLNESDKKRAHIGNGSHICEICNKVCSSSNSLVHHLRLHTGERPYKCEICNKGFISSRNLRVHSYTHTGIRPYKCEICNKTFNLPSLVKRHMRQHTGERPYECQICKKTYTVLGNLKTHIIGHSKKDTYKCEICNKVYISSVGFKNHMRNHTREQPYEALQMSDATSVSKNNPKIKIEPLDFSIEDVKRENEDELDDNVKSESCSEDGKTCLQRFMNSEVTIDEEIKQELDDEGEKLFECSICNKAFITKYLLDLHVCVTLKKHSNLNESDKKRAHIGNGSHICEICNKVCSTSTVLVRHLRLHTGERPYKCEICNKGFISSTNLKAHSYTHTGIYPYECERCHKTYRFPTSLKKHMLSHFKRAYECQICKKTFVVLSSLKAHMPIHSEERPYNCGICNKAYTLKGNLKKHMRSHTEEGTL